jgi:hypothetical protein
MPTLTTLAAISSRSAYFGNLLRSEMRGVTT